MLPEYFPCYPMVYLGLPLYSCWLKAQVDTGRIIYGILAPGFNFLNFFTQFKKFRLLDIGLKDFHCTFKVSSCSLGARMSCCVALLNSPRDFCMVLMLLLKLWSGKSATMVQGIYVKVILPPYHYI